MQYTYLGGTELQVSRITLGTMNFGELTNKVDSFKIMDEVIDQGINFFDTADVSGLNKGGNMNSVMNNIH